MIKFAILTSIPVAIQQWSGRESAIGTSDSLLISAAVAECASFFLLRRESEAEPMEMNVAKQFAQFWLEVLEKYLSSDAATSIAKTADMSLMRTLSDSFCKLDESSYNRPHSAIYGIRDWFWNDSIQATALVAKGSLAEQRLANLWNNVMMQQQREELYQSHAYSVVRKRFHATLSNYQDASDSVPDEHAYNLMIASVKYCGAQFIFAQGENTTVEQFLINDLLRWVVKHTSSLSKREGRRDHLATFDFTLLRMCLVCVASPHKQKSLWESILREIIAAHCNLGLLSEGLVVLLRETDQAEPAGSVWKEILRCETMENFAIQIGEEAVSRYQSHFSKDFGDVDEESVDDEAYGEDARKTALFLRTCIGLSRGSSAVLVGQRVVHRWTEIAAPGGKEQVFLLGGNVDLESPLIATLLSLVSMGGDDLLTPDGAERVVLESWRLGGRQWEEVAVPLLLTQEGAKSQHLCSDQTIIRSGAKELQELLSVLCHTSDNDHRHVAVICHVWSERAFRILSLSMKGVKASGNNREPKPSLALIGLANSDMWRVALSDDEDILVSHLYLCLVYLLQQFESPFDRLELFLQSSDSPSILAVNILLALSDANDQCVFDPMSRRDQKCAWLLTLLGGRENIPIDIVQSWCREAIRIVSSGMNSDNLTDSGCVRRGVSVLSELLLILFDKVVSDEGTGASSFDIVDASNVREGDNLWYIANPENANVRERAQVVKIHADDFPRLYFTIRVEQSDGVQERQTVAKRLRKLSRSPNTFIDEAMISRFSEGERVQRSVLGDLMFEELVNPVLSSLPEGMENSIVEPAAECLSLIISHCGLLGKAGVGTTRYKVFRLLSSVQSHIAQTMVSSDKPKNAASSLRVLSLAMGLGDVVSASIHNFKLMKFKPDESLKSILQYYGDNVPNANETSSIDRSVLEWLIVAIGDVEDETVCRDTISLLYKLSVSTFNQSGRSKEDALTDSMLVMRAVQNAQKAALLAQEDEGQFNDLEQDVMAGLIKSFAHDWESTIDHDLQNQVLDVDKRTKELLPVWHHSLLSLLVATEDLRGGLIPMAARRNCEGLVENLFSSDKRWFAFRLLDAAAGVGQALHGDYYCGHKTKREVDKWQKDLLEEEAEELRDDVGLVGQWMPENIMNELESWKDNDENNEATAIGRMLCWLCFLSFADSAVAAEVRFRGSVSAYLDKARAVSSVLDTALSYLSTDKDRNNKRNIAYTVADALDSPRFLDVSKLAALVVFRTVEVFPTQIKHWWEDDCPKALCLAVSQFVETKVAPEILRRELSRINKATNLGEMSVSGSTVSREVTATYIQDECQLSIVIQIPPTFPLRNVEVDGRRTLGIPEKKWKRWALNIRVMLNNQDGTLLDALMLWKENVDKEFAGLEPCPVCYSIISVKTHELPNLQCNTCSNSFHSSCLYKWFHSSGKSQCVLCQQPWSGTRIQKRA